MVHVALVKSFESINFYFLLLQFQVFIARCRKSGFSECTFCVSSGNLGALRLKVRLIEDHILPSVYYQPLIHLLVESVVTPTEVSPIHSSSTLNPCWFTSPCRQSSEHPSPQVEDSSALTLLEEVTTVESRQDVAMTLVKIYLGQGLVVPFLDYLNTREVQHTSKAE